MIDGGGEEILQQPAGIGEFVHLYRATVRMPMILLDASRAESAAFPRECVGVVEAKHSFSIPVAQRQGITDPVRYLRGALAPPASILTPQPHNIDENHDPNDRLSTRENENCLHVLSSALPALGMIEKTSPGNSAELSIKAFYSFGGLPDASMPRNTSYGSLLPPR